MSHVDPASGLAAIGELLQVSWLGDEPDALERYALQTAELLAHHLDLKGATVTLDCGDGHGPRPLAQVGQVAEGEGRVLALPMGRPWSGRLSLAGFPGTEPARILAELSADRLGAVCEHERLRLSDLRRQDWLSYQAEVSELLAHSIDISLTQALIPRLVVPRLADWAGVFTVVSGQWELAAATHADETRLPWLMSVLDHQRPDIVGHRLRQALVSGGYTPLDSPIEGFAVPLIAHGQRLGCLAMGCDNPRRPDAEVIKIGEDLARRAALALDNARIHAERQRVARTLQESLMPPVLPQLPGMGLGAEYVSVSDGIDVGGDFYDCLSFPDGRALVFIGDVCGKGVQAATTTGLVRDIIKVLLADGRPVSELLTVVNDTLGRRQGLYCTLAMASVSPVGDGGLKVALNLAGHDRPLLLRADGSCREVGTWGTALGLISQVQSEPEVFRLEPGDTLVFFTDGVTERRAGGELFGTERLSQALSQMAGLPAQVIAAQVRAAASSFSMEPLRDDMAIVALRNEN